MIRETEAVLDANEALMSLMEVHRSAAIPAMIGVCAMWAVNNGGSDLMKSTLRNAIDMVDQMEQVKKESAQ